MPLLTLYVNDVEEPVTNVALAGLKLSIRASSVKINLRRVLALKSAVNICIARCLASKKIKLNFVKLNQISFDISSAQTIFVLFLRRCLGR